MNTTLALGIVVLFIEVLDFLIKKYAKDWAGMIPLINTLIGFLGSYLMRVDLVASLAACGVTMVSYDTVHGFMKFTKNCSKLD